MAIEGLSLAREQVELELTAALNSGVRVEKKRIGVALHVQVDQLTAVDTGEARRGWHFSIGRQSEANREPAGGDALQELVQLVDESVAGDPLYLQNNVPHIEVLDQGGFTPPDPGPSKDPRPGRFGKVLVKGGYSVQAPSGIGAVAVDQVASDLGLQRTAGE